ncbi:ATP-dependent DNA ligase [Pseudactinotalea terrae]|uniref:ATP-dependent DNA ligase n=1 Tax=Pseudactinotalea terrae TaxID=1743262 RepID=UPI0012E1A361|nr:ATP-dependent DNA ligase [Pseudactinotalea terrae]
MPTGHQVALAKAAERIPTPTALPGGTWYEPKWDGFRAVIGRGERVRISSRTGTDLTDRFPEIAAAAERDLPPGCTIDGELVAWEAGRLDFPALQRRMVSSKSGIAEQARTGAVAYVAFDVLEVAGNDTRHLPLRHRLALLRELAAGWSPPLSLTMGTDDVEQARAWFDELAAAGLEGIVAKGLGQRYEPGQRIWTKVKRRDALDVVVAAVTGTRQAPTDLLVGLPIDGQIRIVGRTAALSGARAAQVGALLAPPEGVPLWPAQVPRRWVERFTGNQDPLRLTPVRPVVVEVLADAAWDGRSFRHALRLVRVRPDLDVEQVRLPAHLGRPGSP